ncbi:hypothetical protein [Dactylosporangium sp. CA-233914]|uniref:hypothetical protein n=1 Tax=Dactylosporangium sp. CA-233914 TaxID=3239934 RepID=UPI003D8DB7C0
MAQELRADPDELITLAVACLDAAGTLGGHYHAGLRDLTLPPDAFGNTGASPSTAYVAAEVHRFAEDALAAHVRIAEEDADGLLQAAFAYREADGWADQRLGNSRRAPA